MLNMQWQSSKILRRRIVKGYCKVVDKFQFFNEIFGMRCNISRTNWATELRDHSKWSSWAMLNMYLSQKFQICFAWSIRRQRRAFWVMTHWHCRFPLTLRIASNEMFIVKITIPFSTTCLYAQVHILNDDVYDAINWNAYAIPML